MTGQDWKRVEMELAESLPGPETKNRLTPDPAAKTAGRQADEESILKHIADALQFDEIR